MYNPPKSQFQEIYNMFGYSPKQFDFGDGVYVLSEVNKSNIDVLTIGPQKHLYEIKEESEFYNLKLELVGYK